MLNFGEEIEVTRGGGGVTTQGTDCAGTDGADAYCASTDCAGHRAR